MLTAIRSHPAKVGSYISKVENHDSPESARIAAEHGLYEEVFTIYKYKRHLDREYRQHRA